MEAKPINMENNYYLESEEEAKYISFNL